jgi:RNA polymerase sigma-70 factor (ECF subfamily)
MTMGHKKGSGKRKKKGEAAGSSVGTPRDSSGTPAALPRAVVEGVRRRDHEALGQLYEAFVERIYSLSYRLLGERTAAEDVTQEVFVRIYGAADRLDPERDPGPWITTITYNLCRDFGRSKGRRAARSVALDEAPGGALASPGRDPEAEVLRSERERKVREAILALPERLRAVVVLHDYQGLSHETIAAVVGASHAAVRKRYSRALARLAKLLKGVLE